jgi:hypothetical protein
MDTPETTESPEQHINSFTLETKDIKILLEKNEAQRANILEILRYPHGYFM